MFLISVAKLGNKVLAEEASDDLSRAITRCHDLSQSFTGEADSIAVYHYSNGRVIFWLRYNLSGDNWVAARV